MPNLNSIDFSGIPKKDDAALGGIDFTGIPKEGEAEKPPELQIKEEFAPREVPKWSVVNMPQGIDEQPIKESLLISSLFDVSPKLVMENLEAFKLKDPEIKGWGEADNVGWSKSLDKAISMLKPVPALAAGGLIEAGAGALALGGFDKKAKEWRDDVKLVREQIQLEDPVERGSWSEATRNAFTSIYTQAPAYGIGLLLKSGGAALSILGAQAGLQKTSELIEEGEEKGLAAGMGLIAGSSEALTEMIPFGAFADIVKKSPGVGKSMVKLFLGEQAGEQMNTAVDFAIDSVTVSPDMGWEDYLQRVKSTAKATLVQTGVMGAGAGTYRFAVERGETKELVNEMPEGLRKIFDETKKDAAGEGMEDVKATMTALDAVDQTEDGKAYFEDTIKAVPEAEPSIEDVFERITQEDLTEAELDEVLESVAGGREAFEEQVVSAPVAEIKQRLLDTGMDEIEASSNAALFDGFRVLAERAGLSTEEVVARYLPQVTREAAPVTEVTDVERAAVGDNSFLSQRFTTEEQLSNPDLLSNAREELTNILQDQKEEQTFSDEEIQQVNEAIGFIDQRAGAIREQPGQEAIAEGEAPRARIRFAPAGINIELLKDADKSSFVHETGHLYFRVMRDLSSLESATPQLKQDFTSIKDWLGVTEEQQGEITREQEEQFARGFEAFLREGKAPTPALRQTFENFKQWLMEVYQSLLDLDVTLSDDIRGVMDRMLADEGMEVAEREGALFEEGTVPPQISAEDVLEQKAIPLPKDEGEFWKLPANSKEWSELDIDEMDRAAFGFSEGDITTLEPGQLNIKWQQDYDNVIEEQRDSGLSKEAYSEKIDLTEPIEVIYEDRQFKVDDGYHRWFAATALSKALNVEVVIKDKPHRNIVENAIIDGKTVPNEVLAPYPDLIKAKAEGKLLDFVQKDLARPVAIPEAEVFEQAPSPELIDQREKDLQATQKGDIFNLEETKRRIENELYIHDRLPQEISSSELTGRLENAQAIARGSLKAVSENDAGSISVNGDISGRRTEFTAIRKAEAKALKTWAEKNGLVNKNVENVVASTKGKLKGGEENIVFFSGKNNAWVKANKLTTAPTYNELFNRIALHNNQLPNTAYKFQGFATVRGEFMPIFSQDNFVSDPGVADVKKVEMAGEYLESLGYEKNPANDRQWLKGDIVVQDILAKNISVSDGKVFIFDPVIFLNPATKSDRVIGESIAVAREDIGVEADLEGIEGVEVFDQPTPKKPRKVPVKTRVRKVTGQVKPSELKQLRDEYVAVARASREAFKSGKNLGAVKEAQKLKRILARARKIKDVRNYFKLTDAELKSISRKNPLLLSQYEFKLYIDNVRRKAVEIEAKSLQKAILMQTIYEKDLGRVDNYRRAMGLPTISKMTTKQLEKFTEALEPFHDGDVFLSERELQTVDRTDLAGIRTWREAKERLSEELGVSIEELETIRVKEWDEYKWDTALMEANPFYRMLVTETSRKLMEAEVSFHDIETEVFRLAKASEKSRNRTFVEKAIPQDKQIMAYIETPIDDRAEIAETMTPQQLDFAHYIESYFQIALDYLIKTKSLERGRQNYFVHMRRPFLENVKDAGLIRAFKDIFKSYQEDEATFNIMDEDTGNILPLEKFFQFTLRRTGGIDPTTNVTRAFLTYAQMMEKKIALDELIPKVDIYAQSLTPQTYTPRGLEIDRSLKKFVNKYINNKKGRRIRWIAKQGGTIDVSIRGMRTFTTIMDLGANIPAGISAFVGEKAVNYQMLGARGYTKGLARSKTKQGKAILKKYEAFIGRSAWEEFRAPGKIITERLIEGMFGLFHQASVSANKTFLLGIITKKEFDAGEITNERLTELKLEMGRFRVVPGTKSLVGSTSAGSALIQYKSWAVPALRTNLKNLEILVKDLSKKPPGEALATREAREIYRLIGLVVTATIVYGMATGEDEDQSFTGQLIKRVYRETMTSIQALDPTLWLARPRIASFLWDLSRNLKALITLEEYKTKPGLKGIDGLQRQLIPRALRQFDTEEVQGR